MLVLLVLATLFGTVFGTLADVAADRHLLPADPATRALVQSERQPSLEGPMRELSRFGSGQILVPLNLVALLVLWRRHRRLSLFIPGVSAGAVVFEGIAKWTVDRPRPNLSHYGFPSGHTLAAVAFFGAVAYVLWRLAPRRGWAWAGGAVAAAAIVGIAFSRLYLDAHWLSDVLGGLTGGMAYLLLGIVVFETVSSRSAGDSV
jgi:membrane-associated phospholipid phosphatase